MKISHKFLSCCLAVAAFSSIAYADELPSRGPIPFEVFDINKDGSISKDEFNKTIEQRIKVAKEQEGRMMRNSKNHLSFEEIDSNGDGKISKVELLEAQLKRYQDSGARGGKRGCR